MARHRNTGDGDEYEDVDEAALADFLYDDLYEEEDEEEGTGEGETGTIDVEAQIEWAGTIDQNSRDGVRRTRLDDVPLAEIKQAAGELGKAKRTGPAEPFKSYRAKGWRGQLRQMLSTKRGQAAARDAGLNRDTIRRWQGGAQAPSAASRAKISGAYGQLRDPRSAAVAKAQHGLADALTGALRQRYGVNVRLRDIRHLHIRGD
jgi:hypothetical protein